MAAQKTRSSRDDGSEIEKPFSGETRRRSTQRSRAMPRPELALDLYVEPAVLGAESIRRIARTIGNLKWYEILGVGPDARVDTVRRAYAELVALWPPDPLPSQLVRVRSDIEVITAHIENAFRMLTKPPTIVPPTRRVADPTSPTRILDDRRASAQKRNDRKTTVACAAVPSPIAPPRVARENHDTLIDLQRPTLAEEDAFLALRDTELPNSE